MLKTKLNADLKRDVGRYVKDHSGEALTLAESAGRVGGRSAQAATDDGTPASEVSIALHFLPIPLEIAQEARRIRRDRFGHRLAVTRTVAPCRLCLRIPNEPEELILLSYQPLPDTGPYAEVGPIFVHARSCRPYETIEKFPGDFETRPLVVRAYGHEGQIVDAAVTEPGGAQARAAAYLADDAIAEVHVRHVSYTCYDFKIVRAPAA